MHVHTVNVDHLAIANKQKEFSKVMCNADIIVADGMPIVWYSKLVGKRLPERIAGVDLCYSLLEMSRKSGYKVFLLGAQHQVGLMAKRNMEIQYPGLEIVGVYSPTPDEIADDSKSRAIVERINESQAHIVLVALGAPKQEIWISKYRGLLKSNINIGVGATLDFMAGLVNRAPLSLQRMGLEWLYRWQQEPKRLFKRYFIQDFVFFYLVFVDLKIHVLNLQRREN